MGDDKPALSGPDLTKGIAAESINEGALLLGHADGEPVMLTRCDGHIFAVGARCSHYGAPLAEGLVVGDTIRCPWHHAAFSLRTGEALRPPALGNLPCWKVEERAGLAVVLDRITPSSRLAPTHAPHTRRSSAPESVVILG